MKTDVLKALEAKRLAYARDLVQREQDEAILKQRELNAELYLKYKQQKRLAFWKNIFYYVLSIVSALVFYFILKTFV